MSVHMSDETNIAKKVESLPTSQKNKISRPYGITLVSYPNIIHIQLYLS